MLKDSRYERGRKKYVSFYHFVFIEIAQHPEENQTHDLWIEMHVLYRCVTTTALSDKFFFIIVILWYLW